VWEAPVFAYFLIFIEKLLFDKNPLTQVCT
jgi:hypothetical protein